MLTLILIYWIYLHMSQIIGNKSKLMPKDDFSRTITTHLEIEGLHQWSGAKELPEVEYLQHPHRHIFFIDTVHSVNHNDRDLEFIKLGHEIESWLGVRFWSKRYKLMDFGEMSSEAIAELILTHFVAEQVTVSEDGENAGTVIR